MKASRSIPKSVLAALAALTIAAPVAGAVPVYDGHPPHHALQGEAYDVDRDTGAYTPADASADMHASTVRPYEQRYDTKVEQYEGAPVEDGLWRTKPDLYLAIAKVEPLNRALLDLDCWITGIRRDQAPTRSGNVPWIVLWTA